MAEKNFFEVWSKESPETMKGFMDFTGGLMKNSGLDEKTFQLIYMAIQASRGGLGSVAAHAGFAKKAGATRDEVKGAILLTLMTNGINGVSDALALALDSYDNTPVKKSGIKPVVCINKFYTDTDAEVELIKRLCKEQGVRCAASDHWRYGGEGAKELAEAVIDACEEPVDLKFLYPLEMPLRQRVELIAKEVYGADGVDWSPLATEKAERFESDPQCSVCGCPRWT